MHKVIVLVLLLAMPLSAFDLADRTLGIVSRQGHNSQTVVDAKSGAGMDNARIYRICRQSGLPGAMAVDFVADIRDSDKLAGELILRYRTLFPGLETADFRIFSNKLVLDKYYYFNFMQTYKGIDVWGSRLGLRSTPEGKIFFVSGELFPNIAVDPKPAFGADFCRTIAITGIDFDENTDPTTSGKLVILPLIYDTTIEYKLCWMFEFNVSSPYAEWRAFVDAQTGELVWRDNISLYERIAGDISGPILPGTPYENPVIEDFANSYIYIDNSIVDTSDHQGHFGFNVAGPSSRELDIYLRGAYMRVINSNGANALFTATVNPGDSLAIQWNDANSTLPQRNAYYHGQAVHDFIKTIDPNLTAMDFSMICRVNVDGSCNAYYSRTDRSVNFYREGGGCPNIALIADVVHHEYGHGLTNLQYDAGSAPDPNGAMHEGFSDFLAAIVTNQPLIGRGFFGPGTYLRTVDNNRRYPIHWNGESHNDGQIIAGALWDLREMLSARPGYAETLWQFAKYGYAPDFESFFWDLLVTDDDDGNIDNGTPHAYEIFYSFGNLHGIGPGIQINITHTPLNDTEDSLTAYAVAAVIDGFNGFDQGSVEIHYEIAGDTHVVAMTNTGGDNWQGNIPPQHFGTTVRYYIEAIDNLGFRGTSPAGAPDNQHSFYVGYDTIAPSLSVVFLPPGNSVRLHGPYGPFVFRATDVNGIDLNSGSVIYRVNNEPEDTVAIPYIDSAGAFVLNSLSLGRTLSLGDTVFYRFSCRDGAHLHNQGFAPTSGDYRIAISERELVDDFENGDLLWQYISPGWVLVDDQGYQSTHCLRTGTGNYQNNMNALICNRQAYNFALFDSVTLGIRARYLLTAGDSCFVVVSQNLSGPWTRLANIAGASQWRQMWVDLSQFCGPTGNSIYFGFNFVSDASGTNFGVLIDNVTLDVRIRTDVGEIANSIPVAFQLDPIYPNPFNSSAAIALVMPSRQPVKIDIYDILGRVVRSIDIGHLEAGYHRVIWDGNNNKGETVGSGVYFIRVQAGPYSGIKSASLIK